MATPIEYLLDASSYKVPCEHVIAQTGATFPFPRGFVNRLLSSTHDNDVSLQQNNLFLMNYEHFADEQKHLFN
jgi:hypothetical protein